MRKQIVRISIHQTSKVIAAMHAAMFTVLFILPLALGQMFHHHVGTGLAIFVFVPLLSWLFMYIGYVVACWFYNLVVPWTGGIEIDVAELKTQPLPESVERVEKPIASPMVPPVEPPPVNPDRIDRL